MTYRSEAWRRAIAALPCSCCKLEGSTQAAHPNHRGKGLGLKSPDCWTFPLCVDCHRDFDQGTTLDNATKRRLADEWILEAIKTLAEGGVLCIK